MNLEIQMLGVCCNNVEHVAAQSADLVIQSADSPSSSADLTVEGNVLPATQGLVNSQNQVHTGAYQIC